MGLGDLLKPVGEAGKVVGNGVGKVAGAVNPISGMKGEFQTAAAQASEQITLFANLVLILLVIIAIASVTTAVFSYKNYRSSKN